MFTQFLKAGYPVFSIRPIIDGKCQCGDPSCTKPGKHPYDKGWEHTPVWSIEKLEEQVKRGRMSNYAVLVKGLLVVDTDPKNGGSPEQLGELIDGCGFIVRTGSGGFHYYFSLPEELALSTNLPEYPGIDFKSSGYVVGPGSNHISGKKYEVFLGSVGEISQAPQALIDLLLKPDTVRVDGEVDISVKEIADMLQHIDPDCEEPTWRTIGGAIHYLTGGSQDGLTLFDYWSSQGEKYTGWESCYDKWKRYGHTQNPAGIGTLRHLAREGGYDEPVTYECDIDWGFIEGYDDPLPKARETPDNLDLQRPPGFVGEVCDWINSQCLKPRERLAAVASLVAVGNIAGLQYQDDLPYGTTSNLIAFCIASSGSGKNAIKKCVSTIHREAGFGRVTYGKSKSSQEIYRSLISYQSCLFNIDELGIKFQAIANASKSGASFYETWFAEIMSIYSNADGVVDLQADEYKEIEKTLTAEAAFCRDRIENNEDPSGKYKRILDRIETRLKGDLALNRPFLSLIGYSTPERFNAMVTPDRVTEGFIGRGLLVMEPIDVVKKKRDFNPRPMSNKIKNTLMMLASGGKAGEEVDVLQNHDARITIRTTDEAKRELTRLTEVIEELEEHYESSNGMHAIPARAEELIVKISFILAIPTAVRTLEHVKWATAYVMRDIETKVALAVGNTKDANALENKIMANLTRDNWTTTAQIRNRCRPMDMATLQLTLYKMRDKKIILETERADGRSKNKLVSVWKLV
jgi:hypothetical protein